MANFNRGNRFGGGRDFSRRGFNNRGSDRQAVMHKATCDRCGKDCEVPFRPTSGKPVFCSSCFESSKGSDSRSGNFEEKRMFEAVCDECGNSCKVPFQPSSGKPVYCSNCFGEKKGVGGNGNGQSQPQYQKQFEELNNKLDKILIMLAPNKEQTVSTKKETKVAKKKPSKKK